MNWKLCSTLAAVTLLAACGGGGDECANYTTVMMEAPLIQTEDGRLVRVPGKFVQVEVCAD
jgi:hypothetical protein